MNVRRALRFQTLATTINFILSFVSVVVISRLLTPEEIGIFAVATSLIAYTHILREFGVGQYYVQKPQLTRELLRAGFTVMLLVSWTIAGLLFSTGGIVSKFYGHPGLSDILSILSINFLILPFGSPILSLLKREMQFGSLAAVSIVNSIVQVGVTLTSAYCGQSYMSMVWGSLAGNIANVLLLSALRPDCALLTPTARGIREVISFGSKASASSILTELENTSPTLIMGKTLGFGDVANFGRASSLNNMILGKINEIIQQIFFPAFAKGLRDGNSAKEMYCNAMQRITGITVPLICLLSVTSYPLIIFFFGHQWQDAAFLAIFVCAYQLIRAPVEFAKNALVAGGHIGVVLKCDFVVQIAQILVISLTIWISLREAVILLLAVRIIDFAALSRALFSRYGLPPRDLLRAVLPSYLLIPVSLAGPIISEMILYTQDLDPPLFTRLALSGTLFLAGYILILRRSDHPSRAELVSLAPPLALLLGPKAKP